MMKIIFEDNIRITGITSDHVKNICTVSKRAASNCTRNYGHKVHTVSGCGTTHHAPRTMESRISCPLALLQKTWFRGGGGGAGVARIRTDSSGSLQVTCGSGTVFLYLAMGPFEIPNILLQQVNDRWRYNVKERPILVFPIPQFK